jgi:glycosyltransferase involved in cell wall biosynthesis
LAQILDRYRHRLLLVRENLTSQPSLADELKAVERRLLDVSNALLIDIERRRQRRRIGTRVKKWMTPRLGILRHHAPEPLRVPTHYFRIDPPHPAPTISLVTPSFQHGEFLERTILSVLDQRYPELEYIVQDGASTDDTVSVLRRHEASLARWESAPDRGQADAINRGFEHATGEIMAYLNSDDLLLPGSLAYVGRFFASRPDVDVVYGHRLLIDQHDRHVGAWVLPPHDDAILAIVDYVPQETLFWRRRAWDRTGAAMNTEYRFAVDWEFLLRLRLAGAKMVRLPRFLGAFRVHEGQKTARQDDVGRRESERLRQQVLGRTMVPEEISARTQGYLRRHVLYHTIHRAEARLPRSRTHVAVGRSS